jgi:hypothetical protein
MKGSQGSSRASRAEASSPHVWGGVSLIIMAILFLVLVALSADLTSSAPVLSPLQPVTGPGLQTLAQHAELARLTFGVGMISDLVLLPGILGLYGALRWLDRNAMLVAAVFLGVYALIDLVVTGLDAATLVSVAETYASTPTGPSGYSFGVAVYLHSVLSISLPLSSAVMSIGILLVGWTLRGGLAGQFVPCLSYFTGGIGLLYGLSAAVPALTGLVLLSALAELTWFAVVGWKLLASEPLREGALRPPGDAGVLAGQDRTGP